MKEKFESPHGSDINDSLYLIVNPITSRERVIIKPNKNYSFENSTDNLEGIEIYPGGSFKLVNYYKGPAQTQVSLKEKSEFELTGHPLPMYSISLALDSTFIVKYKEISYKFVCHLPQISFQSFYEILNLYRFIKDKVVIGENSKMTFNIPLNKVAVVKYYQKLDKKNKEELDNICLLQNENLLIQNWNDHINRKGFELSGVAHGLAGSALENLPLELIGEIFSHLNLCEITLD